MSKRQSSYGQILARDRVNKALRSMLEKQLVVVTAPMGYGKTTAVREYLRSQNIEPVWISLYDADGTAECFWEKLIDQVAKRNIDFSLKLKSFGFPVVASQTAKIMDIITDRAYEENSVIVLDDFHQMKDDRVFSLITHITRIAVPNLHIVILTRDTSNLPFGEIISLMDIVSMNVLRFEPEEITAYCKLKEVAVTKQELESIFDYTGGWISMIYLMIERVKKGLSIGRTNTVDELVENSLYNSYDKKTQILFLKLSFMESFTLEKAAYVLDMPNIGQTLKLLHKKNAFIYYDEEYDNYIIHNVFLDFLRGKRVSENIDTSLIYQRLGQWSLKEADVITAFKYYHLAGKVEVLLQKLNQQDAPRTNFKKQSRLRDIISELPSELYCKYPFPFLDVACLFILSGEEKQVYLGVKIITAMNDIAQNDPKSFGKDRDRILAGIYIMNIFLVFNDEQKMINYTVKAEKSLKGSTSALMGKNGEFTFGSPHFLYSYYKEAGKLKETADHIIDGFPTFSKISDGCGTGCDLVTLAEYALETGDIKNAELNAYKAVYKARTKEQVGIEICAIFTLVRLCVLQGKGTEVRELLDSLSQNSGVKNSAVYSTTIDLCEGYIYSCTGNYKQIPLWLRTGDDLSATFMMHGIAFVNIVRGKTLLASKSFIELEIETQTAVEAFSIYNNQLGFLHNYIHLAVAKRELYGMTEAKEALRLALEIGKADNIVMPFAENALYIQDILVALAKEDNNNKYLTRLVTLGKKYKKSIDNMKHSVALTEKEIKVLSVAAKGYTRDEIAAEIHISISTVKKHLSSSYVKLNAKNKTAAIKKAKEIKII